MFLMIFQLMCDVTLYVRDVLLAVQTTHNTLMPVAYKIGCHSTGHNLDWTTT